MVFKLVNIRNPNDLVELSVDLNRVFADGKSNFNLNNKTATLRGL